MSLMATRIHINIIRSFLLDTFILLNSITYSKITNAFQQQISNIFLCRGTKKSCLQQQFESILMAVESKIRAEENYNFC